jgi:hypothetical protein
MDFAFSEEQEMLREQVRSFMSDKLNGWSSWPSPTRDGTRRVGVRWPSSGGRGCRCPRSPVAPA